MKVIGICGSSGSGKSTVCAYLSSKGVPTLDCDAIYHKLVESPSACLDEIAELFGKELVKDSRLDRKALGNIVFQDKEALLRLNEISHRHVKEELEREIARLDQEGFCACMIDAPMFFEAGLEKRCDLVCAVIADPEKQIIRICQRDGIHRAEALARLSNQLGADELRKRAHFIIENQFDLESLYSQCELLLSRIREL